MNPSDALYYPSSYYENLGRSCAHYMTFIFARDATPYTFEQHERWQNRLEEFNARILLSAHLDESVAIGAMVLLERFMHSDYPRPAYPHEDYFGYFFGAVWTAEKQFCPRPRPDAFWIGVINILKSEEELKQLQATIVSGLHGDSDIPPDHYIMIQCFVYAHIYLTTSKSAGIAPTDSMALIGRPPCWKEMEARKRQLQRIDDLVRARGDGSAEEEPRTERRSRFRSRASRILRKIHILPYHRF